MKAADAVKAWRHQRSLSQERLAELAGKERTAIARVEQGGNATQATLESIATALGITLLELLSGPSPTWAQPQRDGITTENDFDAPRDVHYREVDLYETIPAGGWSEHAPERSGTMSVLRHLARREGYVVVRVSGDSMYPIIQAGDLVLIDTDAGKPRSGQVVAAIYRGATTLKRYRRIGGKPVLVPDNPAWQPIEVDDPSELVILGVAVHIIDRDISKAG